MQDPQVETLPQDSSLSFSLKRVRYAGFALLLLVLLVDQASKYWVLELFHLPEKVSVLVFPGFRLSMVWNKAITFGLFGRVGIYGPVIFGLLSSIIVVILLVWMLRTQSRMNILVVGAIAGGAIGNIIDRVRFGAVVDFIHLYAYGWSWYVFNIADSAIVCGVIVLLVNSLFFSALAPVRK
ncbi:signal peptidase II [Entomobacter blattae]|uniref:Lipoprotein signal peptidase n=1 Tax=Entomobacter blattae TaxID=2762277 RepID=A0A7H1NUQ5_9PROT|nr:signal peptidase II [Entomobacter blattae]QNT79515.1 Lipoprotein signal peptidase [Entomobacter blattae]